MDFNECMSKGELTTFMTEQRNLMTELTRNVMIRDPATSVDPQRFHPAECFRYGHEDVGPCA